MKYPKTIMLAGQPHRLEFAKLKDKHGCYQPTKLTIRIDTTMPPALTAETVAHEVLHGLFSMAGLSRETWFAKYEERIVDRTTPHFLLWIAQNPQLISCLQEAMSDNEPHEA